MNMRRRVPRCSEGGDAAPAAQSARTLAHDASMRREQLAPLCDKQAERNKDHRPACQRRPAKQSSPVESCCNAVQSVVQSDLLQRCTNLTETCSARPLSDRM